MITPEIYAKAPALDRKDRPSVSAGFREAWRSAQLEAMHPTVALGVLGKAYGLEGGRVTIDALLTAAEGAETPEVDTGPPVEAAQPVEEPEASSYRGEIPVGSEVRQFDTAVTVLTRVIKNNPGAYGFDGDSDIGAHLFAKHLALEIADAARLSKNDWFGDQAIGKLHVVPKKEGESWNVAFVDKSGREIDREELIAEGYMARAGWKQEAVA